jgi:hypothetical protein
VIYSATFVIYSIVILQLIGLKFVIVQDYGWDLDAVPTTDNNLTMSTSTSTSQHELFELSAPAPPKSQIPVFIIPQKDDPRLHGEHHHFVLDGIEKSPFFNLTSDPTEGNLWIIDLHRINNDNNCQRVYAQINEAMKARSIKYNGTIHAPVVTETQGHEWIDDITRWTILLVDWSDRPGLHDPCSFSLLGMENEAQDRQQTEIDVRYAIRSTVQRGPNYLETQFDGISPTFNKTKNRNWRRHAKMINWHIQPDDSTIIRHEKLHTDQQQKQCLHIPYHVRTDHVEVIKRVIQQEQFQKISKHANQPSLNNAAGINDVPADAESYPSEGWDPNSLPRPIDVCHFWQNTWHDSVPDYDSELRDLVSQTLVEMSTSQAEDHHQQQQRLGAISFFVGVKGPLGLAGRQRPQYLYARQLLQCKIVVVVGRDHHEDHYRLMETLASGAMVLSDPMLRPPPGLVKGRHWDTFSSRSELESRIRFYILDQPDRRREIALNGWKLAMTSFRSWHFMEKLVYGTIWSKNTQEPTIRLNSCYDLAFASKID